MASVTKQTIEAAWRKRFEGGERTVKSYRCPAWIASSTTTTRSGASSTSCLASTPRPASDGRARRARLAAWRRDFHLPEAIELAREWKVKVAKGIDPDAEQKAALATQLVETAAAVRTVEHAGRGYTAARAPRWRPATARAFEGDLRVITDALGSVPIHKVTRRMLAASCASSSTAPRPMGIEAPGSSGCGCSWAARSSSRSSATGST